MNIANLTPSQLRQAANLKEKIVTLEKQLAALTGASTPVVVQPAAKKGGMSAAGKARIAAAQKLRWAKVKAAKAKSVVAKPAKKKFTMSAAAKAKISAAAKARWAAKKAGKKA